MDSLFEVILIFGKFQLLYIKYDNYEVSVLVPLFTNL